MPPYIYHIHQALFCIVGMCLFLPAFFIPSICIAVGFLGLVMESYFKGALAAISPYVTYIRTLWLLLTSGMLIISHWPVHNNYKVFIP